MTYLRVFKLVFTSIGVIYVLMATSFLVRGTVVLRDFGVSESAIADPLLQDFFSFFYQLMAFVGVVMVLFGHVTRERTSQLLVASFFCIANILCALRDLSTSDSRFGTHLYKGDQTVAFVYISLVFAAVFGVLAISGWRSLAPKASASGPIFE